MCGQQGCAVIVASICTLAYNCGKHLHSILPTAAITCWDTFKPHFTLNKRKAILVSYYSYSYSSSYYDYLNDLLTSVDGLSNEQNPNELIFCVEHEAVWIAPDVPRVFVIS